MFRTNALHITISLSVVQVLVKDRNLMDSWVSILSHGIRANANHKIDLLPSAKIGLLPSAKVTCHSLIQIAFSVYCGASAVDPGPPEYREEYL
ncbi:hypothetical protein J6590_029693 [Homalodisca vitripennis]|nr:hypothetical protein J6590_029693 [Homalodisca vitripennis]